MEEPGPFDWLGKHYRLPYVNPWPRPFQQPHPPIWIPAPAASETIEFVAQRRYAYMGIPFFSIEVFRRMFGLFREACQKEGYEAKPEQMQGWVVPIYVAETDKQVREARPARGRGCSTRGSRCRPSSTIPPGTCRRRRCAAC